MSLMLAVLLISSVCEAGLKWDLLFLIFFVSFIAEGGLMSHESGGLFCGVFGGDGGCKDCSCAVENLKVKIFIYTLYTQRL